MLKKLKIFNLLLALTLLFSVVVPLQPVNASETEKQTITILGTSDIHSFIYPWEYKLGEPDNDAGLAKVYSVVKEVREENPDTILIDNGDTIQGTELADVFNKDETVTQPMVAVMNYMKYDAWVLGNHEFNYGLDVLNRIIGEAEFPVLSANIYNEDGTNFVKPYIVKEVNGVKVGILGMTTPNIPRWDGDKVAGLTFNSLIEEGNKWVKILKEEEKADIIFASIHADLDGEYGDDGGDSVRAVAENVDGIDAIIAGHAHSDIEGEIINGVLISEPKRYGNRVSRFDITIEKIDGSWQVVDKQAKNINTYNYEASSEILELAKDFHQKVLDYVNTPIGEATDDFVPAGGLPGIPTAQIQDTALVDLINKVQMEYTGADVSLAALFISDSNLKKGPLTIKDAAYIYKYDNTLYMTKVTGKQLKDLMEWSAKYFNTYQSGDITISFNPSIRGYNYDMFAGVNYDIDISKEPGNRINNLTFKGKPVTDDMELTLALNNYRYNGMKSQGYITEDILFDSYEEYGDDGQIRNLIAKYIKEMKVISPEVDDNWKITGANLDHWAKGSAYELINKGILEIPVSADGRTPNVESVNMHKQVTRGDFIKVLVKALGLELPNVTSTKFADVDESLAPYVQAALNNYITNGASEDSFGTDQVINREQAVTLIIRSLHISAQDKLSNYAYSDIDQVSSWARAGVSKALELGFISGTTKTTISPKMTLDFGQMSAMVDNFLRNKKDFGIKEIDIFATNDFHGALEGGYEAGIAKLAAVFAEYKKENPEGTIILDAGDRFQGTPLSNVFFGKPVIEAFNQIGYSAATIGNHEFDWGIEKVLESREEMNASYPLLAANIYDKTTGERVDWAEPYTIIEQNGVKIGIIGLATTETTITAKLEFIKDFDFKDPAEAANELIPEVKAKGAELIVLLTHVPGEQDRTTKELSGALIDLANSVNDADAIFGGHSHQVVSGMVNGIPVVEGYKNGRMLSHITIFYDTNNDKVVEEYAEVIEVRKTTLPVEPDQEIQTIVDRYNEEVKSAFEEVIGKTTVDLTRDYNNESNIGNWMADIMREKAGTQIAFQNAGGIREDLTTGDITVGEVFTVMPFDNTIVTAEMTGEQIKDVMEQSVTLFKGMMQISGLKVKFDSTQPDYSKIIEITLEDGTLLEMDKKYTVATNDFLSGGQDGFTTLGEVEWTNTYELVRDVMIEKIKEVNEISPQIENRMIDVSKQISKILKAA